MHCSGSQVGPLNALHLLSPRVRCGVHCVSQPPTPTGRRNPPTLTPAMLLSLHPCCCCRRHVRSVRVASAAGELMHLLAPRAPRAAAFRRHCASPPGPIAWLVPLSLIHAADGGSYMERERQSNQQVGVGVGHTQSRPCRRYCTTWLALPSPATNRDRVQALMAMQQPLACVCTSQ